MLQAELHTSGRRRGGTPPLTMCLLAIISRKGRSVASCERRKIASQCSELARDIRASSNDTGSERDRVRRCFHLLALSAAREKLNEDVGAELSVGWLSTTTKPSSSTLSEDFSSLESSSTPSVNPSDEWACLSRYCQCRCVCVCACVWFTSRVCG